MTQAPTDPTESTDAAPSAVWQDWSCAVRVAVQGAPTHLQPARDIVTELMNRVAAAIDRFRTDSDVSRVNARPGEPVGVGDLTMTLVSVALRAAERTDGCCDPTIGTAVRAAGYVDDIDEVRRTAARAEAPAPVAGWRSVRLDRNPPRISVVADGLLDLGAIAKAWTADHAAATASAELGVPVMVAIGGDLSVSGGGRAWRIDVSEHERLPGEQVQLGYGGLATSSTAGRRWESTTGPMHHLIDPRSGRPADGRWRTCSVWAPSACAANEASTTALVLGDDAIDWLTSKDRSARLVDHLGEVAYVGDWPRPEGRAA